MSESVSPILIALSSGALGATIGSILTNYIRYYLSKKQEISSDIRKTYLIDTIIPVRNELAYYGNIVMKVMYQMRRNLPLYGNVWKDFVSEIKSREEVRRIIGFEFAQAHSKLPNLYQFGEKVPVATAYAFWWYSNFLDDLLNEKRIEQLLTDKKWMENLLHATRLVQEMRIFFERKLVRLETLIREKHYGSIKDFEHFCQSEEILRIAETLDGFYKTIIREEERHERGEIWGQELADYMNAHMK